MKKVLAIYNKENIITLLKNHFKDSTDYKLFISDERDVVKKAKEIDPDIVLLDIDYKNSDGIEILKNLKYDFQNKDLIIIFFIEETDEYVEILCLDSGADDCIHTSIKHQLFMNKLRALSDRISLKSSNNILKSDKITVSKEEMVVKKDNQKIQLTKKELDLFLLFNSKINKIILKEEIINTIWKNANANANNIDVLLHSLKKKIGNEYFLTLRGRGYKFSIP